MVIRFPCPTCRRALRVAEQFAGRSSKCPGCSTRVTVPAVSPPDEIVMPIEELPTTAAIRTAPPAPAGGDPFAFDQASSEPAGDNWEQATAETAGALSADWRSVRRGLLLVRSGTIVNIFTLLTLFIGVIILTFMGAAVAGQLMPDAGPGYTRPADRFRSADEAGLAVFGVVLFLGFTFVIGTLSATVLRLLGLARCTIVPAGTGAQGLAWGALLCELLPFLGYAVIFSGALIHRGFGTLGQGINGLAGLAGMICFLLFLRQVGVALGGTELPAQVLNYVMWIVISVATTMAMGCLAFVVIFAMGAGIAVGEQSREAIAGMGIMALSIMVLFGVVVLTMGIILVVKYVGLLTLASNEIRRRAGKIAA